MTSRFIPYCLGVALFAALVSEAAAADPIVFVSAFAGGEKGGIHALQLDLASGALKPLVKTAGVENPFFLALSPDHKFLYSIHSKAFGGKEPDDVAAYQIVSRSGELKLLNRQSAKGSAACYLYLDATGKTVVVANYSSGSVAALPVNADGSLKEAASFIQHAGTSVDPKRQTAPHAHSIVVSPNNRFVLAADLGLDQVLIYRLDAATAKLTPNDPPFAKSSAGAGPRHLTFHPNGKRVYVINEMGNSVTVFDWDAESGKLTDKQTISTVPSDFSGKSYCADLKITPDGKYLYGTNRGHDSVAAYRIADDGTLTLLDIVPSLGKGPQNLAITADGQWLLCANMPGGNVVVFRIDPQTGSLKATGEPAAVPSASCIMLLP